MASRHFPAALRNTVWQTHTLPELVEVFGGPGAIPAADHSLVLGAIELFLETSSDIRTCVAQVALRQQGLHVTNEPAGSAPPFEHFERRPRRRFIANRARKYSCVLQAGIKVALPVSVVDSVVGQMRRRCCELRMLRAKSAVRRPHPGPTEEKPEGIRKPEQTGSPQRSNQQELHAAKTGRRRHFIFRPVELLSSAF